MTKRSGGGDNLPVMLGALGLCGVAVVGLVMWGRSNAGASSSRPPSGLPLEPAGFFPSLRVGDSVLVDAASANVPVANGNTFVGVVDMLLSDPSVVSVRALTTAFAGTIPRASIVRVLLAPPGGVFV